MSEIRPALYYPYIHIRDEEWLKATLLCVPAVKRMIPSDYNPEDSVLIKPYTELDGPAGKLLQAIPAYNGAAVVAQMNLLHLIQNRIDEIKKLYGRRSAPEVDEYWIHDAKFASQLLVFLEENDLAWRSHNPEGVGSRNWFALHPTLGKAIMTCIGLSTARDTDLDIVTAAGEYHEALLTTREDEVFEALLFRPGSPGRESKAGTQRTLGQLVVQLSGIRLKALPPEAIPELQASKQFSSFRKTLRAAAQNVVHDGNPQDYERQLREAAQDIVDAWQDSLHQTERIFRGLVSKVVEGALEVGMAQGEGERLAKGVIALWKVGKGVVEVSKGRRETQHYLTQVSKAQSASLLIQFPLGL